MDKTYISKFSGEEIDERLGLTDNIPTKVSELENDEDYIKESDIQVLSSQDILELLV